jgi:hypothetical protein
MVDAWGGWSQFQVLLQTLKKVASKHGVSIPNVAVKYVLDQVKSIHPLNNKYESILTLDKPHCEVPFVWYGL